MGDMVIVAYRPKPGQEETLLQLTREHVPALRDLGFATDRATLAMTNKDGVVVEVFEWADGAVGKAHHHPAVQAMWGRYEKACDYVPLESLPEAKDLFATFKPIEL